MASIRMAWAAALLLAGCSSTPRVEEHFGEAVRANLSAQVINQRTAPNTNPARGLDGQAARAAQERYEKSFAQPEKGQDQPLTTQLGGK